MAFIRKSELINYLSAGSFTPTEEKISDCYDNDSLVFSIGFIITNYHQFAKRCHSNAESKQHIKFLNTTDK